MVLSFLELLDQRSLRTTCTRMVAAFNRAVANEHYIAAAGSESGPRFRDGGIQIRRRVRFPAFKSVVLWVGLNSQRIDPDVRSTVLDVSGWRFAQVG